MAFTLPITFKARKGQSQVIEGDSEENDAPMVEIVNKKDEPKGPSSVNTKLGEFQLNVQKIKLTIQRVRMMNLG